MMSAAVDPPGRMARGLVQAAAQSHQRLLCRTSCVAASRRIDAPAIGKLAARVRMFDRLVRIHFLAPIGTYRDNGAE